MFSFWFLHPANQKPPIQDFTHLCSGRSRSPHPIVPSTPNMPACLSNNGVSYFCTDFPSWSASTSKSAALSLCPGNVLGLKYCTLVFILMACSSCYLFFCVFYLRGFSPSSAISITPAWMLHQTTQGAFIIVFSGNQRAACFQPCQNA